VELKDPGAGKLLENTLATRSKEMSWACQATRCRLWAAVIAEGFPMRGDLPGTKRRKILLSTGTGYHPIAEGKKKRMSIHGRDISPELAR